MAGNYIVRTLALMAFAIAHPLLAQQPLPTDPQLLGRLVDIGGYSIHLRCTGTGAPTAVLESGAGDFSFDWWLVQSGIGAFTRVCSYDRAGYAWSQSGARPRTLKQLALEEHALLTAAGEKRPVVLVGHSLGGLIVRTYATQYPADVAGVVLVDATHEDDQMMLNDKVVRLRETSRTRSIPDPKIIRPPSAGSTSDTAGGTASAADIPTLDAPYRNLPASIQAIRLWAMTRASYKAARSGEFDFLGEEAAELHAERERNAVPFGDLPLVVVTRKDAASGHARLQEDLSHLSRNGKLVIAGSMDHAVHLMDPTTVIAAVKEVVGTTRDRRR